MIILPAVGRLVYSVLGMEQLPNGLIKVFAMIEMSVPTANSLVMLIVIVAQTLPVLGPHLEEDVATTILWQYVAVPIFFTLNTAAVLNLVFGEA